MVAEFYEQKRRGVAVAETKNLIALPLLTFIGVNLYTFGVALGPPNVEFGPPQWCSRPPQSLKDARV